MSPGLLLHRSHGSLALFCGAQWVDILKIQPVFIRAGGKTSGWSFSTLMDGAWEIWSRCGGVRCIAFEVLPPRYVNDPDYWVVNDWDEGYALMDEVLDVPCDWCSPCGDVNYHHLAHELGHALGLCHPKSAHNCREAINSLLRALIYIGKRACTGSQDIRD
ncbi:hypothetical protein J7K76_03245 [Candidatus Bipolaricaulota bacterium]|nr:hypothetical protein [Candidatus Bipolaricaulota bacterium]